MEARSSYALTAIGNDRIALVGGYASGAYLDSVDVWSLSTKAWKTYKMKDKRRNCSAVAIDETLFIFGGFDGIGRLSSCEMLDLSVEKSESKLLPAMTCARSSAAAELFTTKPKLSCWAV